MSKSAYIDKDSNDALAEQALRAQQAEADSSVRTTVDTASPVPVAVASLASASIGATTTTAASDSEAAATAAGATESVASHALAPLNAAKGLGDTVVSDAQAAHPYTSAEIASASAIMTSEIKGGALSKFDTQLAALYLEHSSQASATAAATSTVLQFANTIATDSSGHTYVTIDAHAKDGDGAALLTELQSLGSGFLHGSSYEGIASGQVEVSQLGSLLHMADLSSAHESGHITDAGLVTSQAVQAEAVDTANNEFGLDGSGLKIGVLSDSFDTGNGVGINGQPDTMATDIASGDLPTDTTILQDYGVRGTANYGTDEGRGMAQLIHDIAPGASIEFATAYYGEAGFANNIEGLASAGAKEIVDDINYFGDTAFQNSIISQAVDDVSTNKGVVYFSSAGNNFDAGWTGAAIFESANVNAQSMFGASAPNENIQLVQFASGEDYLPLTAPDLGAGHVYYSEDYIDLQWNDPDSDSQGSGQAGSGNGPTTDLDLFVYDVTRHTLLAVSDDNNAVTGDPIEVAVVPGYTDYINSGKTITPYIGGDDVRVYVGAATLGATPPTEIKVLSLGDGLPFELGDANTNATAQTTETSYGHNAAPDAVTVGAANYANTPAYGALTPLNDYYSSDGAGVTLYYDDNGNRLATPEVLQKVDLTAVDGADTTFFGYDSDGDGYPNFSGTSAAAPDAAAVGLLMLQADPNLTPADIRHLEMDSAIPMADVSGTSEIGGTGTNDFTLGYNGTAGAGLIQADKAIGFIENGLVIQNDAQTALYGTGGADTIYGGPNAMVIEGFGGADTLVAGKGADTFVYSAVSDSTASAFDIIDGFKSGTDAIDLRAVDNGEVFLAQQSDGSTYVLFDLVNGQFEGQIYSTDTVSVKDVFVNPGTLVVDYGSASGGALRGGANNDVLIAQGGETTLKGNGGGDIMYSAAAGMDTYIYNKAFDSNLTNSTTYDTIFDFKVGIDKIDLTGTATTTVVISHFEGSSYIYFDPDAGYTQGGGYDGFTYVSGASLQAMDVIAPGAQLILEGNSDGDTLVGGTGNDILIAGAGTEFLTGGHGQDIMYAGSGDDIFVINGPQDSTFAAPDTIEDFKSGVDTIDLSGTAATLNAMEFSYDDNGNTRINFVSDGAHTYYGAVNVVGAHVEVTDVYMGGANPSIDLEGSSNADVLNGSTQFTVFNGHGGADTLNGGTGENYFLYYAVSDSTPTAFDTIDNFKTGTDKIDVSAIDGGQVSLDFVMGGTFVEYAPDGNGGFQGDIFVSAAVAAGDLITSTNATVSVDPASTDVAAAHAAEVAIQSLHTSSVFGH